MRILILGGAGFVGTNLRRRLSRKHEVVIFDKERTNPVEDDCEYIRGDIADYISIHDAIYSVDPNCVFHLAGMVSRLECEETPTLAIQTNVQGAYNVGRICSDLGSRLMYAGSSEEYGSKYSEGRITEDTPFGPATGMYSLTKRVAEEMLQHFSCVHGLETTIMRYFMLYGPGEPFNEYRSAISRFVNLAIRNKPLPVHPGTSRSWCYIQDAVDAMELLLERPQKETCEVFNIGRHDPIETLALAQQIIHLTGSESEIVQTQPGPTVIPNKQADFSKILREVGWEAKIPLTLGLEKTIIRARRDL